METKVDMLNDDDAVDGNSAPDTGSPAGVLNPMDRREVLGLLGGLLGTALISGCGGSGSSVASTSTTGTTGTTTTTTTTDPSTTLTPEGEIGPYFADDSASGFNRSNILSNLDGTSTQSGIPLTLKVYVYDSENSYAALAGAQVDIWHCNASGIYSDESVESTSSETWLRGYQLTDSTGLVTFKTIFPGWYQGRTTHIHLRIRSKYSEASSTSDGTNTTQVFFPQATIDAINTSVSPYSALGTNPTTNASDHVYTPETEGETLLTLSGDNAAGYTTSFTVNLPITAV